MDNLLRDSIALGDGCLRAIVRTGNASLDRLADAIEAASLEDVALLAVAMNRKTRTGGENASSDVPR
jgi:hypothetical protein